jgi:hypothetical protein
MPFTITMLRILNLIKQFKPSSHILTNVVISVATYITVIKQTHHMDPVALPVHPASQ